MLLPDLNGRALGLVALALLGIGCDATPRGRDAQAPLSHRVSEISVRMEVPSGGSPSISVQAFKATVAGLQGDDVLGVVDPLVGVAPESRCELRDVASAARALRTRGSTIELEALDDVAVELGGGAPLLRPAPRVYPDYASIVAGVVNEIGPVDMAIVPDSLIVGETGPGGVISRFPVSLPAAPRVTDAEGNALASAARFDPSGDLTLQVSGPPRTFVELRPFGATLTVACPVPASATGRLTIPAEMIRRLNLQSGNVPVSLDAVWRESHFGRVAGNATRLSLEVRASAVLDLRQ